MRVVIVPLSVFLFVTVCVSIGQNNVEHKLVSTPVVWLTVIPVEPSNVRTVVGVDPFFLTQTFSHHINVII